MKLGSPATSEELVRLTGEILAGTHRITGIDEALSVYRAADLNVLGEQANRLRLEFCGRRADLCAILNAKCGLCPEDCKYCAQSAHWKTETQVFPFIDKAPALQQAAVHADAGVHRYAMVTSGTALAGHDLQKALEIFREMHSAVRFEGLCASFGILPESDLRALRAAGVTRYHHNIETSREFYPNICTTHTFDDRLATLHNARLAEMELCCGGIIGMGETDRDRAGFALTLQQLDVRSIPVNILVPIPGTPLENQPPLAEDEILRTVAMLRFVNPKADIRLAGGRMMLSGQGEQAFRFGANAAITGNMLTTCGNTIAADKALLTALGFDLSRNTGPQSVGSEF